MKKSNEDSPNGSVFVKSYKDLKGSIFNIVLLPTGGMKMPRVHANAGVRGAGKRPLAPQSFHFGSCRTRPPHSMQT
eukprot:464069-Pyramimonas_sp.AAC.1